ncbi:uncharacterized protein C12orf45 homolog [Limulus polyphemus]|uniref:Uncharacterized protein C12orf45 homolog n=1 Tax=Limulus polyphemus TaxID=6850 RepID=A0ABM1BTZ9_LIMPO|nr:uncharacterized protein C12orf45 homolog [Limulus polyphemus]
METAQMELKTKTNEEVNIENVTSCDGSVIEMTLAVFENDEHINLEDENRDVSSGETSDEDENHDVSSGDSSDEDENCVLKTGLSLEIDKPSKNVNPKIEVLPSIQQT